MTAIDLYSFSVQVRQQTGFWPESGLTPYYTEDANCVRLTEDMFRWNDMRPLQVGQTGVLQLDLLYTYSAGTDGVDLDVSNVDNIIFRAFNPITQAIAFQRTNKVLCDSHVAGIYQIIPDADQRSRITPSGAPPATGNRGRMLWVYTGEQDDNQLPPGRWPWALSLDLTVGAAKQQNVVARGVIEILPKVPR